MAHGGRATAATTATCAPRRSASARARRTRRPASSPTPNATGRADAVDDQRRDDADPRHQQQGAGPDHALRCRPTTATPSSGSGRSNEVLGGRRLRARGVQQLHPDAAGRRRPEQERSARRRSARQTTAPSVDEALRIRNLNRNFVAKALGVYAQDLVEVVPHWKVLAGLRWDRFEGELREPDVGHLPGRVALGLALEQPLRRALAAEPRRSPPTRRTALRSTPRASSTTTTCPGRRRRPRRAATSRSARSWSCSTAGCRAGSPSSRRPSTTSATATRPKASRSSTSSCRASGTPPASSSTSPAGSRRRWEMFLSYAWIPSAEIDEAAFGVTPSGERVGDRPSMTPQAQRLAVHDLPAVREARASAAASTGAARRRRSAIRPASSRPAT